jgi:hypothetical protein
MFAVSTVITFDCVLSSALITAGADMNVKNKDGVTCLCACVICVIFAGCAYYPCFVMWLDVVVRAAVCFDALCVVYVYDPRLACC